MMEFNESKPIYLQLADRIMDDVESGNSEGGERLLSVRDFASRAGVNANTVMRTYTWLQQEGVIYNQRGIGYFFTEDALNKILEKRRKIFFDKELLYFLNRLSALQITPEELTRLYKEFIQP